MYWISVVQSFSCVWLCDPMDYSTPGFPVLYYLLEFAQTHVHWGNNTVQSSHPLLPPFPAFSLSASESFSMSPLFTPGGQSIVASASASVLPKNIQGWFPLELTDIILMFFLSSLSYMSDDILGTGNIKMKKLCSSPGILVLVEDIMNSV